MDWFSGWEKKCMWLHLQAKFTNPFKNSIFISEVREKTQIIKSESETKQDHLTPAWPSQGSISPTANRVSQTPWLSLPPCFCQVPAAPAAWKTNFTHQNGRKLSNQRKECKYARLERKRWLNKCQSRGEAAEELAHISKERLKKGQEDMESIGGRAELQQSWLSAPRYRNIAHVVSCSIKVKANLCFWKSFPSTSLAPSFIAGLLHTQPDH